MTVIKIVNKSDRDVSWFCYNSYDDAKGIALFKGSGDLAAGEVSHMSRRGTVLATTTFGSRTPKAV